MEEICTGTTPQFSRLKPGDLPDSLSPSNHERGANGPVQRTGASRFAQRQIERLRRPAPGADLCVRPTRHDPGQGAKCHSRFALAAAGFVLVAAGLAAAYWWHYKLAPMRHLADPAWLSAHSETARWEEEQKDYRRFGSSPDLCFGGDRIGFYGDKRFRIRAWQVPGVHPKRTPDPNRVEPCAAPNGGPARRLGNSGVAEGPPSVS